MRNFIGLIAVLMLSYGWSAAQTGYGTQTNTWAFGAIAGPAHYYGDVGTSSQPGRPFIADVQLKRTRYTIGGYTRYSLPNLGIPFLDALPIFARANLLFTRVAGDDELADYPPRKNRNLSFRTDIYELSLGLAYRVWQKTFISGGFGGGNRHEFTIFGHVGVGGFYFNPKTEYKGEWVSLQPLGTEGQGVIPGKEKYSRWQVCIPFSAKITYSWNPSRYRLGLEVGWRKTFTDYLDDVSTTYADPDKIRQAHGDVAAELSIRADELDHYEEIKQYHSAGAQRGDPSEDDSYSYLGLQFTYFLRKRGRVIAPSF